MNETIEALITSDSSPSGCINVWDIQTGTQIHSYKNGGVSTPSTISAIKNDYLISGENLKPLLHIWKLNSQEPLPKSVIRLVVPGIINCLTVCPNGMYCAAGIDEKLYIWQLSTGRLLNVISKHFQPITRIAFTPDGAHLITAGNDSLVLIWNFAHLIIKSEQQNDLLIGQTVAGQTDPVYTISDHSMPVKGLFVTDTRLITVSTDRTCKLYDLFAGRLLQSIVFDVCLTAVVVNKAETYAYIGGINGQIFELSLVEAPRNIEQHYNSNNILNGHTKTINCLALTIDGNILVSGSADEQVNIWHIATKQKLKTIPHKAPITNLRFICVRKNTFHQDFKTSCVVKSLERNINTEDKDDYIEIQHNTDLILNSEEHETNISVVKQNNYQNQDLQDEINKLKVINAGLYKYALDNIVQNNQNNQNSQNKRKRSMY